MSADKPSRERLGLMMIRDGLLTMLGVAQLDGVNNAFAKSHQQAADFANAVSFRLDELEDRLNKVQRCDGALEVADDEAPLAK